jgi:hypothetical protein
LGLSIPLLLVLTVDVPGSRTVTWCVEMERGSTKLVSSFNVLHTGCFFHRILPLKQNCVKAGLFVG